MVILIAFIGIFLLLQEKLIDYGGELIITWIGDGNGFGQVMKENQKINQLSYNLIIQYLVRLMMFMRLLGEQLKK